MSEQAELDPQAEVTALAEVGITRIDLTLLPRSIGEVLEEIAPQGAKLKKQDLADQDIVIRSIRFFRGQYGVGAFVIGTTLEGELFNTILGNKVILSKLALVVDQLPVTARLVRKEGGQGEFYWDIE